MKANEAPEKLYVNFHFIETHPESHQPLVTKQGINKYDIEYIRKDVFIEKVCEYFHRGLEDTKVIDDYRNILVRGIQASYTSVEEFIEDFRNYMKEE